MRNLLIFLTLFFISQIAQAATQVLTYYKRGTNVCSTSYTDYCTDTFSALTPTVDATHDRERLGCDFFGYVNPQLKHQYRTGYYQSTDGVSYVKWNSWQVSHTTVATKMTKTCQDGEVLKLEGCTATCEVDPCKQLEGTTTSALVSCGTAVCQAGSVIEEGSPLHCSNGVGAHLRSPASSTVIDGCLATNPQNAAGTKVRLSEAVGKSSAPAYCTADYTFTGASAPVEAPLTGLIDLSFLGVTPTTEDGQCPANTTKGQLNGGWVCVPNSGSDGEGGECPTGQIKVGGVCTSSGGDDGNGDDGNGSGGNDNGDDGGIPCPTGQNKINGVCAPTGGTSQDRNYTASSNCDAAPVCDGDVVQCGLMQEAYISKCQLLKSMTEMPEDLKEQLEKVGTESDSSEVSSAKNVANSYLNAMSAAMHFSNSSCPGDFSIAVMGRSISIAISQVCDLFRILRLMLHLAAYFFCLRMLWMSLSTI